MNTTLAEAMVLAGGVWRYTSNNANVKVILAPPTIWLVPIKERFRYLPLAAQNFYHMPEGPYTGETAATMLKGIAKYVIVGHSERRSIFQEDNLMVNAKAKTAFRENLIPILAIGEERVLKLDTDDTAKTVESTVAKSSLWRDLQKSTIGLGESQWEKLIIAYEPVWAIGTKNNADARYVAAIIKALRSLIARRLNTHVAKSVPILYGGSVTRHSAPEYAGQVEIDGVLVGGAGLKIKEFVGIVEAFAESHSWRQKHLED